MCLGLSVRVCLCFSLVLCVSSSLLVSVWGYMCPVISNLHSRSSSHHVSLQRIFLLILDRVCFIIIALFLIEYLHRFVTEYPSTKHVVEFSFQFRSQFLPNLDTNENESFISSYTPDQISSPWGPLKNDVTAKMAISDPPSLPCH